MADCEVLYGNGRGLERYGRAGGGRGVVGAAGRGADSRVFKVCTWLLPQSWGGGEALTCPSVSSEEMTED